VTLFVVWFALGLHRSDFGKSNRGRFGLRRRLFFIASTALLLGLFLLMLAPSYHHRPEAEETIRDIARAFVAAAIIGFIIEFAEIRDFFANMLTHLLTTEDFTRQLSDVALEQHAEAVTKELIRRSVTNPDHAGETLVRPILSATVPHLCATYRESYNERIDYSVIRSDEEMSVCSARVWGEGVQAPLLREPAYLLESRTSFYLIRPRDEVEDYPGEVLIDAKLIDTWRLVLMPVAL